MPEDARPRRSALPPGLPERLAVLEQADEHIRELVDKIEETIAGISSQLKGLSDNVLLLAERGAEAARSRDRWKNWFLGIASAVAVALIIFLATMAWRVQGARLLPPP